MEVPAPDQAFHILAQAGQQFLPQSQIVSRRTHCSCGKIFGNVLHAFACACYLKQAGVLLDLKSLILDKLARCCRYALLADLDGTEELVSLHVQRREASPAWHHPGAYMPALTRMRADALTYAVLYEHGFHTWQWHAVGHAVKALLNKVLATSVVSIEPGLLADASIVGIQACMEPCDVYPVAETPCKSEAILVSGAASIVCHHADGTVATHVFPTQAVPLMCIPGLRIKNQGFMIQGQLYEMLLIPGVRRYRFVLTLPQQPAASRRKASRRKASCALAFGPDAPPHLASLQVFGRMNKGGEALELRLKVPLEKPPPAARPASSRTGLFFPESRKSPDDVTWHRAMPLTHFLAWFLGKSSNEDACEVREIMLSSLQRGLNLYSGAQALHSWAAASLGSSENFEHTLLEGLMPATYIQALGPMASEADLVRVLGEMAALTLLGAHGLVAPDTLEESYMLQSPGSLYQTLVETAARAALARILRSWLHRPRKRRAEELHVEAPAPLAAVLGAQPPILAKDEDSWIDMPEGVALGQLAEETKVLQILRLTQTQLPIHYTLPAWLPPECGHEGRAPPMWMFANEDTAEVTPFYMHVNLSIKMGPPGAAAAATAQDLVRALATALSSSAGIFTGLCGILTGRDTVHVRNSLTGVPEECFLGERQNPQLLDTYYPKGALGKRANCPGQTLAEDLNLYSDVRLQSGRRAFLPMGCIFQEPLPLATLEVLQLQLREAADALRQAFGPVPPGSPTLPVRCLGLQLLAVTQEQAWATLEALRRCVRNLAVSRGEARLHHVVVDYQQRPRLAEIVVLCSGNEFLVPLQTRRFREQEHRVVQDLGSCSEADIGACHRQWQVEIQALRAVEPQARSFVPSLAALLASGILTYFAPDPHLTLLELPEYNRQAAPGQGIDPMTLGKIVSMHARSICAEGIALGDDGHVSRHAGYAKSAADAATPLLISGTGKCVTDAGTELGANLLNLPTTAAGLKYHAYAIETAVLGCSRADEDSMPIRLKSLHNRMLVDVRKRIIKRNLKEETAVQNKDVCGMKFYQQLQRSRRELTAAMPCNFVTGLGVTGLPLPHSLIKAGECMYINVASKLDKVQGLVASANVWILDVEQFERGGDEVQVHITYCDMSFVAEGQKGSRFDQKMEMTGLREDYGDTAAFFNAPFFYTRTTTESVAKGFWTDALGEAGLTLFPEVHRADVLEPAEQRIRASISCFGTDLSPSQAALLRFRTKGTSVQNHRPLHEGQRGITFGSAPTFRKFTHFCKQQAKMRVSAIGNAQQGLAPRPGGLDPVFRSVQAARKLDSDDGLPGVPLCMACGILGGLCSCPDEDRVPLVESTVRGSLAKAILSLPRVGLVAKAEVRRDSQLVSTGAMASAKRPAAALDSASSHLPWLHYHALHLRKQGSRFYTLGQGPFAFALANALVQICSEPRSLTQASFPIALSGDTSQGYSLEVSEAALRHGLDCLAQDCRQLQDGLRTAGLDGTQAPEEMRLNSDGSLTWLVPAHLRAAACLLIYGGEAMPVLRSYLISWPEELAGLRLCHGFLPPQALPAHLLAFHRAFNPVFLREFLRVLPVTELVEEGIHEVQLQLDTGKPGVDALDFKLSSGAPLFGAACPLGANPLHFGWQLQTTQGCRQPFPAVLRFRFAVVRAEACARLTAWAELPAADLAARRGLVGNTPPALVQLASRSCFEVSPQPDWTSAAEVKAALAALLPDDPICCPQQVFDEAVRLRREEQPPHAQLRQLMADVKFKCNNCGDCRLLLTKTPADVEELSPCLAHLSTNMLGKASEGEKMTTREALLYRTQKRATGRRYAIQQSPMLHVRCNTNEYAQEKPLPRWPTPVECAGGADVFLRAMLPPLALCRSTILRVLNDAAAYIAQQQASIRSQLERL